MHRRAGREDRTFKRVRKRAARFVANRPEQPVLRLGRSRAHVHHQKRAGAERALGHARLEATMPDKRRLLIAGHAVDRNGAAEMRSVRIAEMRVARRRARQHRTRHAQQRTHLVAPVARVEIVEQRARGVGDVRDVGLAIGEPPHEECLNGAEGQLAFLGARP